MEGSLHPNRMNLSQKIRTDRMKFSQDLLALTGARQKGDYIDPPPHIPDFEDYNLLLLKEVSKLSYTGLEGGTLPNFSILKSEQIGAELTASCTGLNGEVAVFGFSNGLIIAYRFKPLTIKKKEEKGEKKIVKID